MRLITLRPHTYNGVNYVDGDTYEADEAYPDVITTLLVMKFAAPAPAAESAAELAPPAAPPPGEATAPPSKPRRR